LALLTTNPELLLAVDLSAAQLNLLELKKVAFQTLAYEDLLVFFGIHEGTDRTTTYNLLKTSLSSSSRAFWDAQPEVVSQGIVFAGKFEKYFGLFRKWILPFIHSRKTTLALLESKSEKKQKEFYSNKWNTFAWKTLFRVFFSRFVLGKYGRDPEFLNEVTVSVSEFIFKKAQEDLSAVKCQENYFLRFILLGEYGNNLPFYLRSDNFQKIRQNLDALQLHQGHLQDGFTNNTFDRFNLSNIFEYMPEQVFMELAVEIAKGANKDARLGYWNLMVPRYLPAASPDLFWADKDSSRQLSKLDNGFFYRHFLVDSRL
jgi:S-adenosylmethionine-diacylglycerol 3-amino-3-carboxypropyl transferase